MDKTAQLVAGVLIVSFVIERITATVGFFLEKPTEDRWKKILLVTITGALAAIAVRTTGIRVLANGMQITTHPRVDMVLTWLVFTAGADRIREFIVPAQKPVADAKPDAVRAVYVENDEGTLTPTTRVG